MRIVKDKPKSTVLTEVFWRTWRLEFIAAHNEKIVKERRRLQSIDASQIKSC